MATSKIKKGDTVKVIVGKDKGREGKVTAVKNGKVIIEGINQVTKHTKPNQANPQGGLVKQSAPIDMSNVISFCCSFVHWFWFICVFMFVVACFISFSFSWVSL